MPPNNSTGAEAGVRGKQAAAEEVPLRPIDGSVSVEDGDAGDVERNPSPPVREQVIQWLKNNWKIFSLILSLGLVTGFTVGYFTGRGTNHSGSVAPDLEPAPTPPYNAPGNIRGQPGPDWISYKNISYYYSEEKLNWTSSKEFCESHGAQLAVLVDPSMEENVKRFKKHGDNHWYGNYKMDGAWKWLNGSSVGDERLNGISGQNCGTWNPSASYEADCSDKKPFICIRE